MESPVLPSMEPEVQSPVEPVSQDLQVRVEALQRELEQANTANAATVEQLNQAAGVLNERITSLKQDKTALEQQLAQAQAGDPQVAELQQQIGETVAARATAEQQLAEVQGRYEAERQASLQQFEAIQATVTTFITRSRENLNGALARIESMNQLLDGGSAAAFGFVLAYGKRQNLVSNRNLYGRQYSTMPNMFGKNYQNELELYSSGSEYSDGYE
jgi:ABC-type transporter Mla subunit MlaD